MSDRINKILKRNRTISCPINLCGGVSTKNPAEILRRALQDALDPVKMPGKCRTLKDMSPEERAAIEAQYGAKITQENQEDLVEVKVVVCSFTDRAVKVKQNTGVSWRHLRWLPLCEVHSDDKLVAGQPATIRIPLRLVKQKGLRRLGMEN